MIPGMNAKQMKKMERQMKKMGMDMKDLKGVKEVIIRLEDKELVIPNAEVSDECNGSRNLSSNW